LRFPIFRSWTSGYIWEVERRVITDAERWIPMLSRRLANREKDERKTKA